MSAILILLGIFSLTFFLSNLGFLKKTHAFSFISIPLTIGILFSPEYGILPILPSTQGNLSWAIRVALTWVTFVAGTRLLVSIPDYSQLKKLAPLLAGYLFFILSAFAIIYIFFISGALPIEENAVTLKLFILALILSSVIFSSRENPFLLPIFFFCLLYLFKDTIYNFTVLNLTIPLSIGILMAIVCRLIISPKDHFNTTSRLTLLGLCTLGTGIAVGTNNLEVILGLSFGWMMAFVHKYGVCSDPKLSNSVIPIKFSIALFCGLYVNLSWSIIAIGIALAMSRLTIKALIVKLFHPAQSRKENYLGILPISQLALPIVLSLQLSLFNNDDTEFILSSFCIAYIANDIMALAIEKLRKSGPLVENEFSAEVAS